MTDRPNLNATELRVLEALAEATPGGELCVSFRYLTEKDLDLKAVRRSCRSLARKGLAEFHRGLMNDDGQVAGAGYCISRAGEAFLAPCDVCSGISTFDYIEDVAGIGIHDRDHDEKSARRILECEEHYKKSSKHGPIATASIV